VARARPAPRFSIIIATYGDLAWEELAHERAKPTALAADPDTLVCSHLRDGTLAEARNLGASDAGGDWLVFLDADDELAPGYLDAMRQAERRKLLHDPDTLARREDGLLAPAVSHCSPAGEWTKPELPNRQKAMTWLNHCVIGTAVPARLFRQVGGFRDDVPIYEDWELWLRCVRAGAKIVDVPDAVYLAHEREGSRNQQASSIETYNRIRAEHLAAS
jgi:GT2 family glycosyltransferase